MIDSSGKQVGFGGDDREGSSPSFPTRQSTASRGMIVSTGTLRFDPVQKYRNPGNSITDHYTIPKRNHSLVGKAFD